MSENKMAAVLATFLLAKNNKNWGPPKIVTKETRWFCVCVGEGLGQPKTRTRCGCDRFYVLLFLESKTEVKGGGAGDIFLDLFFLFSMELLCWFLLRKADALRVSGLDTKKKEQENSRRYKSAKKKRKTTHLMNDGLVRRVAIGWNRSLASIRSSAARGGLV